MRPLLFARMPVMSLSSLGQACANAFREAGLCLLLALRSSLHPTLLLGSAGLCILLSSLWLWLFYHYFELIAQLAGVARRHAGNQLTGARQRQRGGKAADLGDNPPLSAQRLQSHIHRPMRHALARQRHMAALTIALQGV